MDTFQALKILFDQGETNEQIKSLRDAIVMLDGKITYTWWILFAIVVGLELVAASYAWSLDKRLKKVEKFMIGDHA